MVDSAVAMKSALPSPQPARKPMISPTDPDVPASAAKTTMIARPTSNVRFGPKRLDTTPVISIATPVTSM